MKVKRKAGLKINWPVRPIYLLLNSRRKVITPFSEGHEQQEKCTNIGFLSRKEIVSVVCEITVEL